MTKQIDFFKNAQVLIAGKKADYEKLLPKHISADKFMQSVLTFLSDKPDLLKLPSPSLLLATEKAARDGLMIDGREAFLKKQKSGEVFIVVYEAMYRGLLKLVRNTGEVSSVSAHVVYEGEDFSFEIVNGVEKLHHKPDAWGTSKGAKILGAYACATLKDGSAQIVVMSEEEILKRKAVNQYSDSTSSPWQKWPVEQRQKTVLKKLTNMLATSSEKVQKVFEEIEEQDRGDGVVENDNQPLPNDTIAASLPTPEPEKPTVTDANAGQSEKIDAQTGEVTPIKHKTLRETGEEIAKNEGAEGLRKWFVTLNKTQRLEARNFASDLNKIAFEAEEKVKVEVSKKLAEKVKEEKSAPAATKKSSKLHAIVQGKSTTPIYDEIPAEGQPSREAGF